MTSGPQPMTVWTIAEMVCEWLVLWPPRQRAPPLALASRVCHDAAVEAALAQRRRNEAAWTALGSASCTEQKQLGLAALCGRVDTIAAMMPTAVPQLVCGEAWVARSRGSHLLRCVRNARTSGDLSGASLLLRHGADPNKSRWGNVLESAVAPLPAEVTTKLGTKHLVALAELLLEHGADVSGGSNTAAGDQRTPLHAASWCDACAPVVALLLRHGVDPNARNARNDNNTPLHCAADAGARDVVALLLAAGADAAATNAAGLTAAHIAAQRGFIETATLLVGVTPQ